MNLKPSLLFVLKVHKQYGSNMLLLNILKFWHHFHWWGYHYIIFPIKDRRDLCSQGNSVYSKGVNNRKNERRIFFAKMVPFASYFYRGLGSVTKEMSSSLCSYKVCYIWVIDQVWGQDGRIMAKFFFVCLWTSTSSRSINLQKANIQPPWPNKLGQ